MELAVEVSDATRSVACQLICIRGAYAVIFEMTVVATVRGTVTTDKSRLLSAEHDTVGNDPVEMTLTQVCAAPELCWHW